MEKIKIKKSDFIGMCMDHAERQTRRHYKLREESHLNSQQWIFRDGAYSMAYELLQSRYEIVED